MSLYFAPRVLFPGAGFVEYAAAAVKTAVASQSRLALQSVSIPSPLVLPQTFDQAGSLALTCHVNSTSGAVEVASEAIAGRKAVHFAGNAVRLTAGVTATASHHHRMRDAVVSLKVVSAAVPRISPCQSTVASLALPEDTDGYLLHPASADCCLQMGAVPMDSRQTPSLRVPASIQLVQIDAPAANAADCLAWVSATQQHSTQTQTVVDYKTEAMCAGSSFAIKGLVARELEASRRTPAASATPVGIERLMKYARNEIWQLSFQF